jgi:hypothetical protein
MFLFSILPLPKLCSWEFFSALFVTLVSNMVKKGRLISYWLRTMALFPKKNCRISLN